MAGEFASFTYLSRDGLQLHGRDIAPTRDAGRPPVVCLAGLTRSAADFERLARALADHPAAPRRVVALDYRGRGGSQWDRDGSGYTLATERDDILAALARCEIAHAHFVGTSRGGLHIMALAASEHASIIRAAVLNDIGPRLEADGLARIKGYVGQMVRPASLDEAVKLLKIGAGQHFDALSPDEWRVFATTTFGEDESDLHLRYDPALARTLDAFDLTKPLPESWDAFDALRPRPVLTIRGTRSDLLSDQTLAEMAGRWPASQALRVAGQGHAPLLADAATIDAVASFLARADDQT